MSILTDLESLNLLQVLVWRDGKEKSLMIEPSSLCFCYRQWNYPLAKPFVVGWCGATIQLPYRQVLEQVNPKHPLIVGKGMPAVDITQVPYISCVSFLAVLFLNDFWISIFLCFVIYFFKNYHLEFFQRRGRL